MNGKVVVITGASDGIGLAAARDLAEQGAELFLVGRSRAKTEAAAARVSAETGNNAVHTLIADLSRQADVRALADELKEKTPAIDILINNAGGMFTKRELTADGIEMTFALNHLAYFLLTHKLYDHLAKAGRARVVSTSSGVHHGATLDFDDLQHEQRYSAMSAYQKSKLCNLYFTFELARRGAQDGITANALHPGFVASNFGNNNGFLMRAALGLAKRIAAVTPEQGASTIVYLASSPEVEDVTGKYFVKSKEAPVSAIARSEKAAKDLWDVSLRMTGETEAAG